MQRESGLANVQKMTGNTSIAISEAAVFGTLSTGFIILMIATGVRSTPFSFAKVRHILANLTVIQKTCSLRSKTHRLF